MLVIDLKRLKHELVVIRAGGLAREFSEFFSKEVNIVGLSSTNTNEERRNES
jgi:hypothetical protein